VYGADGIQDAQNIVKKEPCGQHRDKIVLKKIPNALVLALTINANVVHQAIRVKKAKQ
jgi:hypothetical protein